MSKLKVGDEVESTFWATKGQIGKIVASSSSGAWKIKGFSNTEGARLEDGYPVYSGVNLKLIENNMNLKEKFALVFKSEPEKSFRKAGITDGDDVLTDDGVKVFLGWMLKKHGAEFKTEVVDVILADEKE